MNRSTPHVMVLLPTGRRHAIPRAATNLECSVEAAAPDSPLPTTAVRTILPLARLVHQLKQAKEESHAQQTTSASHPMEALERRIMFVGMTRAMRALLIVIPKSEETNI